MSSPSTVRVAGPSDHQEVWRLFLQAHNENAIFSLAPEKVNWFLNRCLHPDLIPIGDLGPRGVVGVIGPVGALEGLIFLMIGTYWYSADQHLEEYIIFVDPEHRKTGHVQAFINWMKEQVEITKLPLVTGVISNHRTEAKCRLYRRMLPKIGEFFYLGPKGATLAPALITAGSS